MIQQHVIELLGSVSGLDIDPNRLESPQDRMMGDVALPCFHLAKQLGKSPVHIAQEIAQELTPNTYISQIKAAGPYVNFFINTSWLASEIAQEVAKKGDTFGYAPANGKHILLEGWSPNTHKIFHIGHLRNALVSETVARICEAGGYKVTRASYMGDIGAHVAKWLWYYVNFDNSQIPQEQVSAWAGDIYVKAGQKIEENPELYKQQIHDIQEQLESGDPQLVALRKETAQKCIDDMEAINAELGVTKIKRKYLESEVEQPGVALVKELAETATGGIVHSQGAIIKDLEDQDLGVFVLLKSNGTSLYSTKDIALAYLKQQEYDFDKSLYIVATDQLHHFNQLFATLQAIGYEGADELVHVSYAMVELSSGKMSSRAGNIITYYDLRDRMLEEAHVLVADRDFDAAYKEEIAHATAFGAMKFDMLLQDAFKKIIFNMEKALSFEGETGPYVQYTHARCVSILARAGYQELPDQRKPELLTQDMERVLFVQVQQFQDYILNAAENYKPNLIARYVLELARSFNKYYQQTKIIQPEDLDLQLARCVLVACVKQVLANALNLLTIQAPEKM